MNFNLDSLREGKPDCPSDLALDRLVAGELSPDQARPLEQHSASCPDCTSRLEQRKTGFGAFPGLDERKLLAAIRRKADEAPPASALDRALSWLRGHLAPVALVGAAAAALLVVGINRPVTPASEDPQTPHDTTRMKGSLALHVYRQGASGSELALPGEKFHPGDKLRFAVDLPSDGHVKILGVESSGNLYTAWPMDPATTTRHQAGNKIELPGAVALDDSPGREVLHLVHCPDDQAAASCQQKDGNLSCPAACKTTAFPLEKVK